MIRPTLVLLLVVLQTGLEGLNFPCPVLLIISLLMIMETHSTVIKLLNDITNTYIYIFKVIALSDPNSTWIAPRRPRPTYLFIDDLPVEINYLLDMMILMTLRWFQRI